jgi:hypothetical protein
MAISCPTCGKPAAENDDERRFGKLTRCTSCGTGWFARPAGEAGFGRRKPRLLTTDIADAEVIDEIPAAVARPAMAPPAEKMPTVPQSARPAIRYGVAGTALVIAIALFKVPLMTVLAGLPVANAASGIEFKNVRSETIGIGAARAVVIEGAIVNTLARAVVVPVLRITLKAGDGTDVSSWTLKPDTTELAAGQSVAFKSARLSPHEAATQVTLSVAN